MEQTIHNKFSITKFFLMITAGALYIVQSHAFHPNGKDQPVKIESTFLTQAKHQREIVVLIHGLMRSSLSMASLKLYLKNQGYQVYSYSYPSSRYDIHEHGIFLYQFIDSLLSENRGRKIHFITHSLGGIIIREALANLTKNQLKDIGCLIMLAPPNQGSSLAKSFIKVFPMVVPFIKPLAELSSDQTAYVHRVPIPNIKIGIIAGRYDAKVPPSEARLPGQTEPVIIDTNHAFIMNNPKARQLILTFLEKGKFEE
ncbi:esterase/lipase family protein [Legionella micdadei]|uniref:Alpha/beta hydrolase family protein n=1 Tax=Legionella micdadei TaxID=451 RepID=A0A098GJY8_LEGMI|nr:lipase [Legionella micdadei]ARH01424.1 lipase [Legionella micdadei]KTD28919.1 lipase B [Legionella micdadei]NSL17130.1 alpha/beta fold hydrolase [Legionella micdadei]CEG62300.1 Lipase B [Legionella micdadei]